MALLLVTPGVYAADLNLNASDEASLNAAIASVNAEGAGTHTIEITADINLTASTTVINNASATNIIINGNGYTVDGQETSGVQVFRIEDTTTVAINDLTITGGNAGNNYGGGIYTEGILTLNDTTVSSNESTSFGGGIYNLGTLSVINSIVSENTTGSFGGGIYNRGTATVSNSTVYGNFANFGGGIRNEVNGILEVSNSTISGNRGNFGAGIYNIKATSNTPGAVDAVAVVNNSTISGNTANYGGGVYNSGTMTLGNSTVSGNSANDDGGGIRNNGGMLTLINSTVSDNSADEDGGGIHNNSSGMVTLSNSIIADQSDGEDCTNSSSTITSNGHNLDSDGTCELTGTGDLPNGNADLQPLALNAPGTTRTHALGANSAALNAGDNAVCAADPVNGVDQRGVSRPQGNANCDIGAYESDIVVDVCTFPITVNNETELNEAIDCYNAITTAGSYTITIGQDIPLTASTTWIFNSTGGVQLVIEGAGYTVDGQGNSGVRPFEIRISIVEIDDLTITGGNVSGDGGGIYNRGGTLTVSNSTVSGNTAYSGGGIYNDGTLTVSNSTVSGNTAYSGGGIYNDGTLTVSNSTVSGNSGIYYGGGIYNDYDATLTVSNSTVSGNSSFTGGGIYNESAATLTLSNSIIADQASGTDCYNYNIITSNGHNLDSDGTCELTAAGDIPNGTADLQPLALNAPGSTMTHALGANSDALNTGDNAVCAADPINGVDQRGVSRPQGNACDIGAFELSCPSFPITANNESELNFAIGCYNAITAAGSYTIDIGQGIDLTASTTKISNATADVELVIEGAGYTVDGQGTSGVRPFNIAADTDVTINDLIITGGNVSDSGGGIYNRGGTLTVSNSTVSGNVAGDGGGIYNRGGTLTVSNSTVSGNTTDTYGGGGIYNRGTLTVSNSTVSGNSGIYYGGGIYNDYDATLTVSNSTVSGNSSLTGGGIFNESAATLTLSNSIIADQTSGADCIGTGIVTSNGHNLDSDGTCELTAAGDIPNGTADLQPLALNAPGSTMTHALGANSDALNTGDNAVCAADPINGVDQRGVSRPQGNACDIGAYEQLVGSITVVKDVAAGWPGTDFTFGFFVNDGGWSEVEQFQLSGEDDPKVYDDLFAGEYAIAEYYKSGWKVVGPEDVVCTSEGDSTFGYDNDPNNERSGPHINLAPGDDVTCTISNYRLPIIRAKKYEDLNSNHQKNEGEDWLEGWTMTLYDAQGNEVQSGVTGANGGFVFDPVEPGTYTVCETLINGWANTGSQFNGSDISDANFGDEPCYTHTYEYGDDWTWLFGNIEKVDIWVEKYEDTDGDGHAPNIENEPRVTSVDFDFTVYDASDQIVATGTTGLENNGMDYFGQFLPGTYTVCEESTDGWLNTFAGPSTSVADPEGLGRVCVAQTLGSGQDWTFVFGNYKLAEVTIVKETNPADANWVDFGFKLDEVYFSLNGGIDPETNSESFIVSLGEHEVVEFNSPSNWDLTNATCDNAAYEVDGNSLSFMVPADESGAEITCTFTNERRPQIKITKYDDLNGNGVWDDGEPTIEDWQMFLYISDGNGGWTQIQPREVRTDENGVANYTNLEPGVDHLVCEEDVDGWINTDPGDDAILWDGHICQIVENPVYGEVRPVVFGNYEEASITIVKDAVPDSGVNFVFEGSFGVFKLDDDDDPTLPNSLSFGKLEPGEYTVTEKPKNNWYLTDIQCSAEDQSEVDANIDLENGTVIVSPTSGQHVTCVFTNEQGGRVTVRKYEDLNENGNRNGNEPWLAGWEFTLYDSQTNELGVKYTNNNGALTFGGLDEGTYTVCETDSRIEEDGAWVNSEPGTEEPCYEVEVVFGEKVTVRFGNYALPGSIKVIKEVVWGLNGEDQSQEFELCVEDDCQTVGYNGGEVIFTDLPYGEYTVSETDPGEDWIVEGEGVVVVYPGQQSEITITNTDDRPFCSELDPDADLRNELTYIEDPDGSLWVVGQVTNSSDACSYDVGMASYKMYENSLLSQYLIDYELGTVGPESTIYFEVEICPCAAQVDLFYGDLIEEFVPGLLYGDRLLDALYVKWGEWCENDEKPVEEPGDNGQQEPPVDETPDPETMTVTVEKIVVWGESTPDTNETFDICLMGPSYPEADCQTIGYDGGVLTWTDLEVGEYTAFEQPEGDEWNVDGWGAGDSFFIENTYIAPEDPVDDTGNTGDMDGMEPGDNGQPQDNGDNGGPTDNGQPQETPECTDPNPARDLKHGGSHLTGDSSGVIVNLSDACSYEVGMASYQMVDNTTDNQILFDSRSAQIGPGETLNLSVSLPGCATQVDLFYGPVLQSLFHQRYGDRLIDGRYLSWGNWCGIDPQ